jgi:hypothetical protein
LIPALDFSIETQKANLEDDKDDHNNIKQDWDEITYEETAEGRKAKTIAFGNLRIGREKSPLWDLHWNVRRY